ncbi:hypothetical protein K449DRAFT_383109 [Hypoxylon sp. EC38]|nr:hypothetical protein K449DRAFT_383109 [Hypoxylon sp. EC38]
MQPQSSVAEVLSVNVVGVREVATDMVVDRQLCAYHLIILILYLISDHWIFLKKVAVLICSVLISRLEEVLILPNLRVEVPEVKK